MLTLFLLLDWVYLHVLCLILCLSYRQINHRWRGRRLWLHVVTSSNLPIDEKKNYGIRLRSGYALREQLIYDVTIDNGQPQSNAARKSLTMHLKCLIVNQAVHIDLKTRCLLSLPVM